MSEKVVMIEPVGSHGGMDYYDFPLCEGLATNGVDVSLHTCDKTRAPAGAPFSLRHSYMGIYGSAPAWRRGLRYLYGTLKALISGRLETRRVAHFHFFHVGTLEFFNVLLARVLSYKVVITAHDVESFVSTIEKPYMSRFAYALAHAVIAHNRLSQQEVVRCLGKAEEAVSIIPSGNYLHVTRDAPSAEEAKAALGLPAEAKIMLFFGQIKQVKRLDLLIKAMPRIHDRHPEVLLLIAGKTWKTDFSTYQQMIDEAGSADYTVSHIRFIPDEQLPQYYACADLVVLPYERIYQSAVVLMAMSFQRAVLVSDIPGMTELIEHDENGFVFSNGDVDSLVQRVNELLDDDAHREDLARRGYDYMLQQHDWTQIGKVTSELYSSLFR